MDGGVSKRSKFRIFLPVHRQIVFIKKCMTRAHSDFAAVCGGRWVRNGGKELRCARVWSATGVRHWVRFNPGAAWRTPCTYTHADTIPGTPQEPETQNLGNPAEVLRGEHDGSPTSVF